MNLLKARLKACGAYIKRLVFPDHVTPSKILVMLSRCSNVTHVSLPPKTVIADPKKTFNCCTKYAELRETGSSNSKEG